MFDSTYQGISSRYKQLEELWRMTMAANKSIVVPSTLTPKHYGEKLVNMCELFQLPSNIYCTNCTFQSITNVKKCVLTLGINEIKPEYYTLSKTTIRQHHIDFHKTKCVAGYISDHLSTSIKTGFPQHEMSQKYLNLLHTLRKTLGR